MKCTPWSISILKFRMASLLGLSAIREAENRRLCSILNGLIRPTAGRVLYNGEDIWKEGYPLRELRSHVGLVFQYPEHQLFETDVITDVCFGPKNQGLSPEECRKRAEEALDHVGFPKEMYEKIAV